MQFLFHKITAPAKQLLDYLDYYRLSKGYMVVFNFNKKKETGIRNVRFGDKILVEAFL